MDRRSFLAATSFIAGMSALRAQTDVRLGSKYAHSETNSPTHRFAQRRFDSADGQRHYQIFVAVPVIDRPAEGWPAICMLDGNAAFDALQQADLDLVRGHALVGIGYEEGRNDGDARDLDYTPPFIVDGVTFPADPASTEKAGGGDAFLALIAERMLPELTKEFSLDPARRMLWGHSYGGLFALNALFKQPDLFRSYYAISPSVAWHAPLMLHAEGVSKHRAVGQSEVVILYDVAEDPRADERRKARLQKRRMMFEDMFKRLGARADIALTQRAYPGENHGSMFGVGLRAALARGVPK
ncbi:alpha/beta hydrolase [Microvirga calopogonii]|uniref:alpha/beta hydrolase n=1 Tax=Microvirga calopogonii TaxID=2078013 RepID=UPI000E0DA4D3|nr:alpha/beta hydrolase-fold protein [Microvirga calopogonii]